MWNDNTTPLSSPGQITLSKIDEYCQWAIPNQISTISMHISDWVKNLEIYSSYCPETKIRMCCRQTTRSKVDEICPLTIQSRSSQYQCKHQVWWKSIDIYYIYHPDIKKKDLSWAETSVKNWRNFPISNPKVISAISMHIPSLVKIHRYLLKISRNENTDVLRAYSSVKNC